jgi:hypothetical protein
LVSSLIAEESISYLGQGITFLDAVSNDVGDGDLGSREDLLGIGNAVVLEQDDSLFPISVISIGNFCQRFTRLQGVVGHGPPERAHQVKKE